MTGKSAAIQQTKPSDFAGLIKHGIKLLAEVRRLGASKKLTGPAFLALACKHAGLDAWVGGTGGIKIESDEGAVSKLNEIERKVAQAGIAELNGFISRVARAYAGDGYPCPFGSDKFGKAIRVFGVEGETLASINAAKIDIGETLAVAAYRAVRQHSDRFGDISDWTAHQEAWNLAHDQLSGLCAELARSWTWNDMTVSVDGLSESERRGGLVRARFKRAPHVHLGMSGWPMKLIEHAAAHKDDDEPDAESKPVRKKLRPDIEARAS